MSSITGRSPYGWAIPGLIALLLVFPASCTTSEGSIPTPTSPIDFDVTPAPLTSPEPALPEPTATALPVVTATPPLATPSPQTPVTPPDPLTLTVLAPVDASGLEVSFARVMGTTSGTSVSINGLSAEVADNGRFQRDLSLREGVNFIEVMASDDYGQTVSQQITVYVLAPTANLPFTILYPVDGLEVSDSTVSIVGLTRPDAVVGVNDMPVTIDASGVFSTTIRLEEGSNLIEVVATDIEGNVRFQTVAVFYLP